MKLPDLLLRLNMTIDEKYLQEALTHSSHAHEFPAKGPSNERLEFLGDAVVDLIVSEHLFLLRPAMDEGDLSSLRAAAVRESTLAETADTLGLGRMLHLGRGERAAGGARKPSILADAFEAVVAALYLSQGLEEAARFVLAVLPLPESGEECPSLDAKSELAQWTQRNRARLPAYEILRKEGPDHAPSFTVCVSIDEEDLAIGRGTSKQEAEEAAAANALNFLRRR